MKRVILFLLLLFLFFCGIGYCKVIRLPPEGELYDIKEKDALEEIYEKAKKVDLNLLRQRMIESAQRRLNIDYPLEKACKNNEFSFLPYYTLPFDITDDKGNILYPKGYTFNPLDYLIGPKPYKFVFFNGKSKIEMEWISKQKDLMEYAILIATQGNIKELVDKLKRPVYAFSDEMQERFRITKTPSIATFEGNKVLVREIGVYQCKNKN